MTDKPQTANARRQARHRARVKAAKEAGTNIVSLATSQDHPKPKPAKEPAKGTPFKVTEDMIRRAMIPHHERTIAEDQLVVFKDVDQNSPFAIPKPAPGVLPGRKNRKLAFDQDGEGFGNMISALNWSQTAIASAFLEGQEFLGYPYLALLAQRSEYRRPVEIIAREMTRKWIKIKTRSSDKGKQDKIDTINTAMDNLRARDVFRKSIEVDGFFGRSHIYIDTGDSEKRKELVTSIGDGNDQVSKAKIGKGDLKRLAVIEPVWTYPTNYNSFDPLVPNWYKPPSWFVMGKELHASRLLTIVGRDVPDLLKPAYSFGGLSLSQMLKPYVDNWLRTRQSVSDLVQRFSTSGLATNLAAWTEEGGDDLWRRLRLFSANRNNSGIMAIDKETEDFFLQQTALGTLDALQGQTQEHMAAVVGIPLVIMFGIQPMGLNASSDGEIRSFYDSITAAQEHLLRVPITKVLHFVMLSEFGEVDDDIVFDFEPLWELDEKALADMRKTEMDTDVGYIDAGVLDPEEVRVRLASNLDSPYNDINPSDVPELPVNEAGAPFNSRKRIGGEEPQPGEEGPGEASNGGDPDTASDEADIPDQIDDNPDEDGDSIPSDTAMDAWPEVLQLTGDGNADDDGGDLIMPPWGFLVDAEENG